MLLLLLLACHKPDTGLPVQDTPPVDTSTPDTETASPDTDTGEIVIPEVVTLSVAVVETMPTVAIATWETAAPSTGHVVYGTDGALDLRTAEETAPSTIHTQWLVGFPEDSAANAHVASDANAGLTSDIVSWQTGALASKPSGISQTTAQPDAVQPGFAFFPLTGPSGSWVVMMDARGRLVWVDAAGRNIFRVRRSVDGTSIFVNDDNVAGASYGIRRISLSGEPERDIRLTDGHHDFALIDDTHFLVILYAPVEVEGRTYLGDALAEMDEDGNTRVIWDVNDLLEPDTRMSWPASDWQPGAYDWTHINFIWYDATEGAAWLTAHGTNTVFKVDVASGETLWTLGDGYGDFTNTGEDPMVFRPHSVQPVDGGILLFNQGDTPRGWCSEAVEIALDEAAGTAGRVWSYTPDPCLNLSFMGSAQALPNGNRVFGAATEGWWDEITPDLQNVRRVTMPGGYLVNYVEVVSGFDQRVN